jgi:hypothetical protein
MTEDRGWKIEDRAPSSILHLQSSTICFASQKIYRRMLTFMITPIANIMEASAEPP